MITERDLQEAIAECEGERNPNSNTCIKLAAFYTIKNHLFPEREVLPQVYSYAAPVVETEARIGDYGGSDFLQTVHGMDADEVWGIMDELMQTLQVINPRLYAGVMRKLR